MTQPFVISKAIKVKGLALKFTCFKEDFCRSSFSLVENFSALIRIHSTLKVWIAWKSCNSFRNYVKTKSLRKCRCVECNRDCVISFEGVRIRRLFYFPVLFCNPRIFVCLVYRVQFWQDIPRAVDASSGQGHLEVSFSCWSDTII